MAPTVSRRPCPRGPQRDDAPRPYRESSGLAWSDRHHRRVVLVHGVWPDVACAPDQGTPSSDVDAAEFRTRRGRQRPNTGCSNGGGLLHACTDPPQPGGVTHAALARDDSDCPPKVGASVTSPAMLLVCTFLS